MTSDRKILLVGWDAADWTVISPLVDEGLMPHLTGLIERGVMGNLATLQPMLSPMLWTSIATGKRAYKHGIYGFSEPDWQSNTVRPISSLSRKTKAIWNILNQQGKKSLVVGWWPSSPVEPINGAMVANHFQAAVGPLDQAWPICDGSVHPPELATQLESLRIHPHELDGDLLRNFVPRAAEIDQTQDNRLPSLAKVIAECSSVHAVATHLMATVPDWDFAAVYYDAIDHLSHGFMKYHPPCLPWIEHDDFEMFKDVVRGGYIYHDMMLGRLLQLAGSETTVMLVSDHGFHADHLRPQSLPNEPAGPAAEHRPFGIFVANGPGIKRDDLVFGASLLDITPTILSLFGLPVGRDMDGRVLTSIYQSPAPSWDPREDLPNSGDANTASLIESWDAVEGDDGCHRSASQLDSVVSSQAISRLVDLGYVDQPEATEAEWIDETIRELQYNLARSYVDGGKNSAAAKIFADQWDRWPRESRFGVHLLQTQLEIDVPAARRTMTQLRHRKRDATTWATKQLESTLRDLAMEYPLPTDETIAAAQEKRAISDRIDWDRVSDRDKRRLKRLRGQAGVDPHAFAYLEGCLLHREGRHHEALGMLDQATQTQTANLPSLHLKMGDVCMSLRDWRRAETHYQKAIDFNSHYALAHCGLARVAFRRGDWAAAAAQAALATGLHFCFADAHFIAGLAFGKLGDYPAALASLHNATVTNPDFAAGHRAIARLSWKSLGDQAAHDAHLEQARVIERRLKQANLSTVQSNPTTEAIVVPCSLVPVLRTARDSLPIIGRQSRSKTIVVVSGLPRSGTSMMMQMLAAGGIEVLMDAHRLPDASNERGYFELQDVKGLHRNAGFLQQGAGKAIKIIATLLTSLPERYYYRVVFVRRCCKEIVASQDKMLAKLGRPVGPVDNATLVKLCEQQIRQARELLEKQRLAGVLDYLDIHYDTVLREPECVASELHKFLGEPFDPYKSARAVVTQLRHEG